MKVLHIGKKDNVERFSSADSILNRFEIIDMPNGLTDEEYLSKAGDVDFIIADAVSPVSETLIKNMPNLKLIHSEGVAYNLIDIKAASECEVVVCNSKGMNHSAVAEQALLLMVGMLRNIVQNDASVRTGHQIETKEGYMLSGDLTELADCSVGLVGFGDSAKSTNRLLKAYGVKSVYCNKLHPLSPEEEKEYGVKCVSLCELLAKSDIVSLHVPVNENTFHIANDDFFNQMKHGSYFVNTARGELVDNSALVNALKSEKIKMAGLDTVDNEPVNTSHFLLNQPECITSKIIFSPHIAGITASSFKRSYQMISEDISDFTENKIPRRKVN